MLPPAFYSLIGLAVGDAVGTTHEFKTIEEMKTLPKQTDMIGEGPLELSKGDWTDDTSMALAMAVSMIQKVDVDLGDINYNFWLWAQADFYSSRWYRVDIGIQTERAIISTVEHLTKPVADYSGRAGGNGSLMRLAPVPMLLHKHPHLAIEFSGYSSLCTHNHGGAVDSCRYLGALIVGAIQGATKEELLQGPFIPKNLSRNYWTRHPLCNELLEVVTSRHDEPEAPLFEQTDEQRTLVYNSGGAVQSLKAVLWHLKHSQSFEEGVLNISNLGGDSDTVAAIFGQVAGPLYSRSSGIRQDWVDALTFSSLLQAVSVTLCTMAEHMSAGDIREQPRFSREQNSPRDAYVKPATLTCPNLQVDMLPIIPILKGYQHVLWNKESPLPLSPPLVSRVLRDVYKVVYSWDRERPEDALAPVVKEHKLQLVEYSLFSAVFETMFSILLDCTDRSYFRYAFGDWRFCWRVTEAASYSVLHGQLYSEIEKLSYMMKIIQIHTSSLYCLEYFFYLVQQKLHPFLEFRWTHSVVLENHPAPNLGQVFDAWSRDFINLFGGEHLRQRKDIMLQSVRNPERAQQVMQHYLRPVLQQALPVFMRPGPIFATRDLNVFFGSGVFCKREETKEQKDCDLENFPAEFTSLSPLFKYSDIVVPNTVPPEERQILSGFQSLYAEKEQEKLWLFMHWQLQQLYLQKLSTQECSCFFKGRIVYSRDFDIVEEYVSKAYQENLIQFLNNRKTKHEFDTTNQEIYALSEGVLPPVQLAVKSHDPKIRTKSGLTEINEQIRHLRALIGHIPAPTTFQVAVDRIELKKESIPIFVMTQAQNWIKRYNVTEEVKTNILNAYLYQITRNIGEKSLTDLKQLKHSILLSLWIRLTTEFPLLHSATLPLIPIATIFAEKQQYSFIEYGSPMLQLPPPESALKRTNGIITTAKIFITNSLHQSRLPVVSDEVTQLISKYFINVRQHNYVQEEKDATNLDLYIVVDTNIEKTLQEDFYRDASDKLKATGSLILVATDNQNPSKQVKNTIKVTEDQIVRQEPLLMRLHPLYNHFVLFDAGHFFYMKKSVRGPTPPQNTSQVSFSFATFAPEQPVEPFVPRTVPFLKELWTIDAGIRGVQVRQLTNNETEILAKSTENRVFPMNYFPSQHTADKIARVLNNDWDKVSTLLEIRRGARFYTHAQQLDQYFVSFKVRGQGKCPFLATNALLALKGMPLMDWETTLQAANNYLVEIANSVSPSNTDAWLQFANESRPDFLPSNLQTIQTMLIADFDANAPDKVWLLILSYLYKIKFVLFVNRGDRPNNNNDPQIICSSLFTEKKQKKLPTFFLLLMTGHFYPLFPIRDIPRTFNHEYNIPSE